MAGKRVLDYDPILNDIAVLKSKQERLGGYPRNFAQIARQHNTSVQQIAYIRKNNAEEISKRARKFVV